MGWGGVGWGGVGWGGVGWGGVGWGGVGWGRVGWGGVGWGGGESSHESVSVNTLPFGSFFFKDAIYDVDSKGNHKEENHPFGEFHFLFGDRPIFDGYAEALFFAGSPSFGEGWYMNGNSITVTYLGSCGSLSSWH